MPRKPQNDGLYKRGETWWVRFTIEGEEVRRSLRTSDESIARREAKSTIKDVTASVKNGINRRRFQDVFTAWAAHIQANVALSTAKRYAVSLKQIDYILRDLYIDQIDKALVNRIVTERKKAGVSNATIRRDLTALSQVLDFCIMQEWRDDKDNPALSRSQRITERRDPIILPHLEDVERVIALAPNNLKFLIRAALLTGCRQNELVTAERRNFNPATKQMTVIGKGNKLRSVPLSDDAVALIRSIVPSMRSTYLFWHSDGKPYRNVASRFAALVRSAQNSAQKEGREFRPFRFHDLRHRFAVDSLKSGRTIHSVQKDMGHGSVKVTEIYLAHLTAEEQNSAQFNAQENGSPCAETKVW